MEREKTFLEFKYHAEKKPFYENILFLPPEQFSALPQLYFGACAM